MRRFDPLLEEDPWVKGLRAQSWAEGWEEGWEEGWKKSWKKGLEQDMAERKLRALRRLLMDTVRNRFPSLEAVAEARAAQLEESVVLAVLVRRVVLASDVQEAGRALEVQAAS